MATNNGDSFSSTASSTSASAHGHGDRDVVDSKGVVKLEPSPGETQPSSDTYESGVWANIFDESGIIQLDVEDDPMDETDVVNDPRQRLETITNRSVGASGAGGSGGGITSSVAASDSSARGEVYFPHHVNSMYDPTPSSVLLDNWDYCDVDMSSPSHARTDLTLPFGTAYSSGHHSAFASESLKMEPGTSGTSSGLPSASEATHPTARIPSTVFAFEKQSNGQPFPLSKPILRDDGLLLVGTELAYGAAGAPHGHVSNRIFITSPSSFDPSQPVQFIPAQAEVRDLQWLGPSTALAAVGHDIQILQVDNKAGSWSSSRLLAPIQRVHSEAIREIAANRIASSSVVTIASGGFDGTIVLTTFGENGDPATATLAGKIDAFDVVSSVRWHPGEAARLSWTTDGGDFQMTDIRAHAKPQLEVALSSLVMIDQMGGLFTHEHISPNNVVLGFEMGHLLFLDLRMPRNESCYGVMTAPSAPIGEIRCSTRGTCAMFGVGGFATGTVSASGRELDNIVQASSTRDHVRFHEYKTSGAFSAESNALLAVSDSLGVVSVYADSTKVSGADRSVTSSEGDWRERAV